MRLQSRLDERERGASEVSRPVLGRRETPGPAGHGGSRGGEGTHAGRGPAVSSASKEQHKPDSRTPRTRFPGRASSAGSGSFSMLRTGKNHALSGHCRQQLLGRRIRGCSQRDCFKLQGNKAWRHPCEMRVSEGGTPMGPQAAPRLQGRREARLPPAPPTPSLTLVTSPQPPLPARLGPSALRPAQGPPHAALSQSSKILVFCKAHVHVHVHAHPCTRVHA